MLIRIIACLIILSSMVSAGERCGRSCYHNLTYTANWRPSCYSCHQSESQGPVLGQDYLKYQAMKMIGDQLAWRSQAAARAQTQAEILELFNIAGISGGGGHTTQVGTTQYGYGSSYGYSNTQASPYSEAWGTVDLMTLYKSAARLAETAQAAGSDATGEFSALVKQAVEGQLNALEVEARGRAAAEALKAARGNPPSAWSKSTKISVNQGGITTESTSDFSDALAGCIQLRCVKCHGPERKEAGVDMTKYKEFTGQQWDIVLGALDNPDPKKKMPQGGPPLTFQERTFFMSHRPKE